MDISSNEQQFVLQALKDGFRVDGRGPYDFRPVSLTFGAKYGNVIAQVGSTRVLANVSAEIVRPFPDSPNVGQLIFNTVFSPMANPIYESDKLSQEEVLVSRALEKVLRRSRAVDTEGLCIISGEKVWQIRVDVRLLDDDGNVLDCACIAAIAALLHFRRPDVTVQGEEVIVHPVTERTPIPLSIHHTPICVTFAIFDDGDRLVVDPTLLESRVQTGEMSVSLNIHKEICMISKAGGTPIGLDTLLRCSNVAATKVTEIGELLAKAVNQDTQSRLSKIGQAQGGGLASRTKGDQPSV